MLGIYIIYVNRATEIVFLTTSTDPLLNLHDYHIEVER